MSDQELLEKDFSEILGLSGLEGEERDDMLERLGALVVEGVLIRALADLNDEDAKQMEAFVATDPAPEVLLEELTKYVPNLDVLFLEEVLAFKRECLAVMERARQAEVA